MQFLHAWCCAVLLVRKQSESLLGVDYSCSHTLHPSLPQLHHDCLHHFCLLHLARCRLEDGRMEHCIELDEVVVIKSLLWMFSCIFFLCFGSKSSVKLSFQILRIMLAASFPWIGILKSSCAFPSDVLKITMSSSIYQGARHQITSCNISHLQILWWSPPAVLEIRSKVSKVYLHAKCP